MKTYIAKASTKIDVELEFKAENKEEARKGFQTYLKDFYPQIDPIQDIQYINEIKGICIDCICKNCKSKEKDFFGAGCLRCKNCTGDNVYECDCYTE